MKRRITVLTGMLVLLFMILPAEKVVFREQEEPVSINVLSSSSFEFDVNSFEYMLQDDNIDCMFGQFGNERNKVLPEFSGNFIIPDDMSVSASLTVQERHLVADISRMATRGMLQPETNIKITKPMVMRDFRFVNVGISPFQVEDGKLYLINRGTVELEYSSSDVENVKMSNRQKVSKAFYPLYKNTFENFDAFSRNREDMSCYLVIAPENLMDALEPLLEWKREKGLIVKTITLENIGNDDDDIKDYVTDAYYNWELPPDYVLLVGDENNWTNYRIHTTYTPDPYTDESGASCPGTYTNDRWFFEVDGSAEYDFFTDILYARIPATNAGEVNTMVAKILQYEKDPLSAGLERYKKAIVTANNAYPSQANTKRFCRDRMMEAGFTRVDSVFNEWDASQDIIQYAEEGRHYLNYRGEGWTSGWHGINMYVEHVQQIDNDNKSLIVTGIGCGVARWAASEGGGHCFGEEWVFHGNENDKKGAVIFCGPTWNTHTAWNNNLDRGMYVGIFNENIPSIAAAYERGKLEVFNNFDNTDANKLELTRTAHREYMIMGEPSFALRTGLPEELNVTAPYQIPIGDFGFNVEIAKGGMPVDGATVALTKNGELLAIAESENGIASLFVSTTMDDDQILMTVCENNAVPYQTNLEVVVVDRYVYFEDYTVNDDQGGNGSGYLEPGESVSLDIVFKNFGTEPANTIEIEFSTEEDFITLTDYNLSISQLNGGDTYDSNGDIAFSITSDASTLPSSATFSMHVTTGEGDNWTQPFTVPIHQANMEVVRLFFYDENGIHPPGNLWPDELALLNIGLENTGNGVINSISATLVANHPQVDVTTYQHSADINLEPGETYVGYDAFALEVDNIPSGTELSFELTITISNSSYSKDIVLDFSNNAGVLTSQDAFGPDAYGYYAFDNTDRYYDQKPVYDWVEIDPDMGGNGTYFDYQSSEQNLQIDLPFTFRYYGIDYTDFTISTDGWCCFGDNFVVSMYNFTIPSNHGPEKLLAVYWSDLIQSSGSDNGRIVYGYDDEIHGFVIEYNNVNHQASNSRETFEIILLDPDYYESPTGDGQILYQYKDLTVTTNSTVGIENEAGNIGIMYQYESQMHVTSAPIESGRAILFATVLPSFGIEEDYKLLSVKPKKTLVSNYPNPFNPITTINMDIPNDYMGAEIELNIYNIKGQLVKSFDFGNNSSASISVVWDGTSNSKESVSSGIYFYTMMADKKPLASQKMILIK